MFNSPSTTLDQKKSRSNYPESRVIVLDDDILLFGREDSGLPDSIIGKSDFLISIFMPNLQTGKIDQKGVRSLNLSVACGIAIYEAHKQINFKNFN